MAMVRINLAITPALLRDLDKLAARYGFDRTNALRYCIRRVCDEELTPDRERSRRETEK